MMSEELAKLRHELSRLGLDHTLAALETELQSKKQSTSTADTPLNVNTEEEELCLLPLSVAQPVMSEIEPVGLNQETNSNSEGIALSRFPIFPIRTGHEFGDSDSTDIFGTRLGVGDSEEDPSTPLSFSGRSFTSNASTVLVNPTTGLSPGNSPFASESNPLEESPSLGTQDWMSREDFSENTPPSTEFITSASQGSLVRVNSLNEEQGQMESAFSLQSGPIPFEEEETGLKNEAEFALECLQPPRDLNESKAELEQDSDNQQILNEENFSFPPTPAGSETGTGTALRQLSSLSSRTLSDLQSSESTEKLAKTKPFDASSSSRALSSSLDLSTGSPFTSSFECLSKEEADDPAVGKKHKLDNMKRVSLTLSHNALEWASTANECTFPIIQEQPRSSRSNKSPSKPSRDCFEPERAVPFPLYPFSQDYIDETYDLIDLKIYHKRGKTGFESSKDLYVDRGDVIAGRYQVLKEVGSAVFSKAIRALDLKENKEVCLKMVKNVKDYFDQSLDEIKLLRFLNRLDPDDQQGIVRLQDFFYYREHLFLVFELLKQHLYELQRQSLKICQDSTSEKYFFNLRRIQIIARQLVKTLSYLHSHNIIHADLKPENILVKDLASCTVKVIDLGSSCFVSDYLGTYVQSRSYRAPEVVLGVEYDQKVDVWSLGCVLAELYSGQVLFQTSCLAQLIIKIVSVRGVVPEWMIKEGKYAHQYYSSSGEMLRRCSSRNHSHTSESSQATCTLWGQRGPPSDEAFQDFVSQLLTIDPRQRTTAQEISQHPWLMQNYEE